MKQGRTQEPFRVRVVAYALLLIAAGSLAYSNSFTPLFVGLDAKESIRDNPHIRALWPLSSAMSLDLLSDTAGADDGSKGGTVVRRPILSLSFALNYRLLGPGAEGFHGVNLAIHLIAALLLFGIARRLLAKFTPRDRADGLGAAVALLWLLHPLQTESVTYLVQRAESLMGMFYLATLYAAVRSFDGSRAWAFAAVLACALGMGTKESMVTAPVAVLLCDRAFFRSSWIDALRRRPGFYVALAGTWVVLGALLYWTAGDAAKDFREGRTIAYILSQPGAILHYVRLALWPDALHLYVNTYAFQFRPGLVATTVLIAQVGIVAVALAHAARRLWQGAPLGFAGAWFFLVLAPTSSFVATSDIVQEHRVYLALAGLVAIVVVAIDAILRTLLERRRAAVAGVLLVAVTAAALGVRTYARNEDYRSEFAAVYPQDLQEAYMILVDHELRVRSEVEIEAEARAVLAAEAATVADQAYAHFRLGIIAERNDEDERAREHFMQLTALQPELPHGHTQLGIALQKLGRRDEAEAALRRAIESEPRFASAHLELGVVLAATGRAAAARNSFERAIALQPWYPEAFVELAMGHVDRGELAEARAALETAVHQREAYAEAHHELGSLLRRMGEDARGDEHLRRAAALFEERIRTQRPTAQAEYKLGRLYGELDDRERAAAHLAAALAQDAAFAPAHVELGILARDAGEFATALLHLQTAIAYDPHSADALAELGGLHLERGDAPAAESSLRRALEIDADRADAIENLGVALALQGDWAGAEAALERAFELAPDRDRIAERLAHVRRLRSAEAERVVP